MEIMQLYIRPDVYSILFDFFTMHQSVTYGNNFCVDWSVSQMRWSL